MSKRIEMLRQINYLASEIDAIYHRSSVKLGISDSVSKVLYAINDAGGSCLLSDIYKRSGIGRQTVNSAVRTLEAAKVIYLEQYAGRAKMVFLTEEGKDFAEKTAGRLFEAEMSALDSWEDEEISDYIELMKKHVGCLSRQIELL